MPIPLPVVQTGFEKSIDLAAKKAGRNLRINMGPGAKSIESLSKPLGRLTGKADEFTKSMEAANARVLAFGASVGVISAVTRGMEELVRTTIQVEKSLANINSILNQSQSQLNAFKNTIFDIAKNTEQSFETVSEAALELSRQGLKAEEVTKRLNDALILSRLSGLSAADSVAGLTAAINSFSSSGITSAEVLNKISAAAASAAVSDRDLIEGLKRSGSVAVAAGVQFDELVGIIGALQERTARGGAVIGNSLKTIFTRIQDLDRLQAIRSLGVDITDFQGKVLSSNKIIENLAPTFAKLDQASRVNLADNLVGKFQIAPFLALLEDYNQKVSRSGEIANTSFSAANEAYKRNEALNKTLSAAINQATVSLQELANTLGEIGVTDNFKNLLGFFNSLVSGVQEIFDGEGIGSDLAKGIAKGIGAVITGPGFALLGTVILKLLLDFAKFGTGALKTFFGLNKAAEKQASLQGQITATLLNDKQIRQDILSIENRSISAEQKRREQAEYFETALREQLGLMKRMQGIAATITPSVMSATEPLRGKNAAGGFLPIGAERSDIARGVGGAPSSAKPVVIPNFAFGGGRRGTMVANTSEYIVPNYANGGDAIFNQNMASSMGLPANAKKVRAASGYIPNFANKKSNTKQSDTTERNVNENQNIILLIGTREKGDDPNRIIYGSKGSDGEMRYSATQDAEYLKNIQSNIGYHIHVPTYTIAPDEKGKPPFDTATMSDELSKMVGEKAVENLLQIPNGDKVAAKKGDFLRGYVKPSSMNATSGLMFEGIIQSFLQGDDFNTAKGLKSNTRLDLPVDEHIRSLFGITNPNAGEKGAEAKYSGETKHVKSAADKIYDVMIGHQAAFGSADLSELKIGRIGAGEANKVEGVGVRSTTLFKNLSPEQKAAVMKLNPGAGKAGGLTFNSASGYIPNFAQGALEDAIGRERSAGLPISQIRINQSGKLRNAQNPMGLAVTNTRDEPTGAIPNYADGGTGEVSLTLKDVGSSAKGLKSELDNLNKLINSLNAEIAAGKTTHAEASGQIDQFSQKVTKNAKSQEKIQSAAKQHLKTEQEVTKANKNYLGIVFGLQAGLTALSAATADSNSSLGQWTNIVSDAGSTFAGFLTAGEGLKELSEGMTDADGELTKLGENFSFVGKALGKVGMAVTAFQLLDSITVQLTGSNDALINASEKLADAFDKATIKVEDFDPETRAGFRTSAARVVDMANTVYEGQIDNFAMGGRTEAEMLLQDSMAKAMSLGITEGKLQLAFDRIVTPGETTLLGDTIMTIDEFNRLSDEISLMVKNQIKLNDESRKSFKDMADSLTPQQVAGLTQKNITDKGLGELGLSEEQIKIFRKGQAAMPGGKDAEELDKILKALEDAEAAQKAAVEQINFEEVKNAVKSRLEVFKIQQKIKSEAENELAIGEKLNNISLARKHELQNIIASEQHIKNLNNEVADGLVTQIGNIQGMTSEKYKSLNLDEKINDALKDGKLTQDEALKILEDTAGTLTEGGQLVAAQKEALDLYLQNLYKRADAEDDVNNKLREGEHSLERQYAIKTRLRLEAEKEASKELAQIKRSSNEDVAEIDKRIASIRMGQSGRSIVQQRQENLEIAALEYDKAVKQNERRLEEARATRAAKQRQADLLAEDDPRRAVLRSEGREALKNAYSENRISLQNAKSALETAKSLVHFKDALTLATDAITNLAPELEQLKVTEETAGTSMQRGEARLRRMAIESSIQKGGTPEEILKRINEEPLTRTFEQRMNLKKLTPLEVNSRFMDQMIEASEVFKQNFVSAFAEGIKSVDDLKDALLNTANQFLQAMTKSFVQKWMDGAAASGSGAKSLIGLASGGYISGGSGNKDDVPAMLMGGEFVMNKKAVQKYGMGFFDALNSGSIKGFARGGQVRDREGMFSTPGINGAGPIVGGRNLMAFATQSPFALTRDTFTGNGAFLDAESGRMTMFGRRNNPQFQRVQDAKRSAFDLAVKEEDAKAQAREQRVSLGSMLASAAISTIVGYGIADTVGGDFGKLLGSGIGNLAGTAVTGAPAYGGALGAAATDSEAMESVAKLFSNIPGIGDKIGPYFKTKATGGLIPSAGGTDTVPTMLSGGEFVMNAAATRNIGAGNLQALNSGAGTGDNSDLVAKLDELIRTTESSKSTGEINITINGSNGTETQTAGQETTEDQRALSERIKVAVKQVIADEKRLGGQLRR